MYIDHERREALKGQWKGSARQEIGPDGNPIDYAVTSRVTATSHVIQAEAQLHFQMQGQKYTEHLQITGGFLHDRFLKLEYKISDRPGSIQFGLMILELDPSGRTLSGHFLSYGAESQHIVSGTIQLQKDVQ